MFTWSCVSDGSVALFSCLFQARKKAGTYSATLFGSRPNRNNVILKPKKKFDKKQETASKKTICIFVKK